MSSPSKRKGPFFITVIFIMLSSRGGSFSQPSPEGGHVLDRGADVLIRRPRVDRAEAEGGPAAQAGRGGQGETLGAEAVHDSGLERVQLLLRPPGGPPRGKIAED